MRLNRFLHALIAAASFITVVVPAIAQTALSADETAGLKEAARRGALIHAYDQAAWHGTDDMFARLKDKTSLGGWIVDGPVAAPVLTFFDDDATDPHVIYVGRFRSGKLISGHLLGGADDRALSPARRRLIAARRIAQDAMKASGVEQCSDQPWNSVVLPPAAPGAPTLVYFLSPRTSEATLPFGGHYMVEVSAAGRASEVRRFTRTCLTLPVAAAKDGGKVAAMSISHLLDPVPTEIHVFLSLSAGLPLAVGTAQNRRVWMVEGSHIRALGAVK